MDKFREEIEKGLSSLTDESKILFSVLTSEKLYPNYVAFEARNSWGNSEMLREIISLIYHYLIDNCSASLSDFCGIITRINLVTPDTEDFSDLTTSFALDACTALISTIKFIINKEISEVFEVSVFAIDTVYAFIQLKENFSAFDPSSEIQTEQDDFMIHEKSRQRNLINELSKIEKITEKLIVELRNNKPIIDISLLRDL